MPPPVLLRTPRVPPAGLPAMQQRVPRPAGARLYSPLRGSLFSPVRVSHAVFVPPIALRRREHREPHWMPVTLRMPCLRPLVHNPSAITAVERQRREPNALESRTQFIHAHVLFA